MTLLLQPGAAAINAGLSGRGQSHLLIFRGAGKACEISVFLIFYSGLYNHGSTILLILTSFFPITDTPSKPHIPH